MTVLLGSRNRPQSQGVVPVYTNKLFYYIDVRLDGPLSLSYATISPTILCACVYSFYLTRLCKLPGLGGDKRPLSLENFLWDWQQQAEMGKGDLV